MVVFLELLGHFAGWREACTRDSSSRVYFKLCLAGLPRSITEFRPDVKGVLSGSMVVELQR